jgi:hypothetical protein
MEGASDVRFAHVFKKWDDHGLGVRMEDLSNVLLNLEVTPTRPLLCNLMNLISPIRTAAEVFHDSGDHIQYRPFRHWYRDYMMEEDVGLSENPVMLRNNSQRRPVGRQKPAQIKLPPGRHQVRARACAQARPRTAGTMSRNTCH